MIVQQLLLAVGFALLIAEGILRLLQIGLLLAIGRAQAVDLQLFGGKLRLGALDGDLIRAVVQLEEKLALLDLLVVVHVDLDDATGDVAADRHRVRLHVGIIRRHETAGRQIPVTAAQDGGERQDAHQGQA